MNKKISIGATIALMIISIALTISVTMVVAMRIFNSSVNDVTQRRTMYQYVTEIDKAVRPHYLGTIDEEKLRTALARGYVDGIGDPYAAYLSADEYKAVQQARSGKLTGYGIELSRMEDGMPQITSVSKQSPAASAGVQKGDIVVSLDGTEVTADSYDTVAEKLGVTTSGDKVLIGLRRGDSELSVDLTSSSFDVVTVEGRMVGDIAVIRIAAFTETTPAQFKSVYNKLDNEGAAGFVFDLRNTENGVLSAAQEIIAYLMPRGSYAKLTEQQTDGRGYLSDEQTFGYAGQQPYVGRRGAVRRCPARICDDDGYRQCHCGSWYGAGLLYDRHRRCGNPAFGGFAGAEKGRRNRGRRDYAEQGSPADAGTGGETGAADR